MTETGSLVIGPCEKIPEAIVNPSAQWEIPAYFDGVSYQPFIIPPKIDYWKRRGAFLRTYSTTRRDWNERRRARGDDSVFITAFENYSAFLKKNEWLGYPPADYLARCLDHPEAPLISHSDFDNFEAAQIDREKVNPARWATESMERSGLFDGDAFYPDYFFCAERILEMDLPERIEDGQIIPNDCLRDYPSALPADDPRRLWVNFTDGPMARMTFRREIQQLLLDTFMAGRDFERVVSGKSARDFFGRKVNLKTEGERDSVIVKREEIFGEILDFVSGKLGGVKGVGVKKIAKLLEDHGKHDWLETLKKAPEHALKNFNPSLTVVSLSPLTTGA